MPPRRRAPRRSSEPTSSNGSYNEEDYKTALMAELFGDGHVGVEVGAVTVHHVVQHCEAWIGEGGIGWMHAVTLCQLTFWGHPIFECDR